LRTRPPEIMPTINHFFTENKWIKISLNLNPPEASLDYWLYDNHSSQLTFFFYTACEIEFVVVINVMIHKRFWNLLHLLEFSIMKFKLHFLFKNSSFHWRGH
jgi:hypothetical protein